MRNNIMIKLGKPETTSTGHLMYVGHLMYATTIIAVIVRYVPLLFI